MIASEGLPASQKLCLFYFEIESSFHHSEHFGSKDKSGLQLSQTLTCLVLCFTTCIVHLFARDGLFGFKKIAHCIKSESWKVKQLIGFVIHDMRLNFTSADKHFVIKDLYSPLQ
jgi:hypothetical protein